jgi:NAD(P)-dependent dehydrogenase (short-subunit alcohol dehydrogenase family)
MGMAELSAYVGSKGALIGMARVWARELGPFGITVNIVSPGAFQTAAETIHPDPEGYSRFVISQQAIKRRGDPVEFTKLVAFLLSDEAGFITGQNIRIDGGWVTQ